MEEADQNRGHPSAEFDRTNRPDIDVFQILANQEDIDSDILETTSAVEGTSGDNVGDHTDIETGFVNLEAIGDGKQNRRKPEPQDQLDANNNSIDDNNEGNNTSDTYSSDNNSDNQRSIGIGVCNPDLGNHSEFSRAKLDCLTTSPLHNASKTSRLISRRRRTHRRRCATSYFDYDHDGDIDRTEDDNDYNDNKDNFDESDYYNSEETRSIDIEKSSGSKPETTALLRARRARPKCSTTKLTAETSTTCSSYTNFGRILNCDRIQKYQQTKLKFNDQQEKLQNNQCIAQPFRRRYSVKFESQRDTRPYNVNSNDSKTSDKIKMPSSRSGRQYQVLPVYDDYRATRKLSSSSRRRESHRYGGPGGYSKLSHHDYSRTTKKNTFFQDLKRFLLLLIIVGLCCFLLWKIYDILIDECNYLGVVETKSELGRFKKYAVSTDAKPCAKVGSKLLARGGSAVDAAIGTLLCMGVVLPNSLGLGGGCLITVYDKSTRKGHVIDGREVAPSYATENMFNDIPDQASRGPLSVGVPGELAAYWKAHQLFGKLKWEELFEDSIEMADQGHPVVEHLAYALRDQDHAKYIREPLAKIYMNNVTNEYVNLDEILVQKELASTLRRIRDHGVADFYGGQTGQSFIEDLKSQGGKMTIDDLKNYTVVVKEPLTFDIDEELKLYTPPPPGSGIVLSIILRIMKELGYYKNLRPQSSFEGSSLYYHRLVESFKHAYAQRAALEDSPDDPDRMTKLMSKLMSDTYIKEAASRIDNTTHNDDRYGGYENFREDHGTAHVSILDADGNAVAVTSSVNLYFGSGLVSPSTGIIYNDVMDDFVSPKLVNKFGLAPSNYNRIRPGRRPLSSMTPSVFTDRLGNARLILGASGGSKITTAIASVSLRNCFLDEDIKTAIDGPRIHHQFLPNKIAYEGNFPKDLLQSLVIDRGHSITPIIGRSSVVMAIAASVQANSTYITANSDYRKGGSVDGL